MFCVWLILGVDGFGERHVVLFAQCLGITLIVEATEDFGSFESTNDDPLIAIVVEDRHLTADGLGFGAVCFHYSTTLRAIACAVKYLFAFFSNSHKALIFTLLERRLGEASRHLS